MFILIQSRFVPISHTIVPFTRAVVGFALASRKAGNSNRLRLEECRAMLREMIEATESWSGNLWLLA